MNIHQLFKNCAIDLIRPDGSTYALSAGTDGSPIVSDEWDMAGYDSFALVTLLGAVSASGVMTQFVKASNTAGTYGSGTVDKLGSSLTNSAPGDGDNKAMVIEVHRTKRRYHKATSQRTAGNVVVLAMFVIKFNARQAPVPAAGTDIDAASYMNEPTPSAT